MLVLTQKLSCILSKGFLKDSGSGKPIYGGFDGGVLFS